MSETVQIDSTGTRVALGKFRATLAQRGELMRALGNLMLRSIYLTFREEGSPASSWPRLAESTLKKKGYGAGHKLLIQSGRLRNSIHVASDNNQATIGTNLVYAAVHQFGSKDRGGVFGPRTAAMEKSAVSVKEHSYDRLSGSLGTGRAKTVDKLGRSRIVRRAIAGPRNQLKVHVAGHKRHQNIPARPYIVFRPEDPSRIEAAVNAFVQRAVKSAGLGAKP